MVHSIIIGGDLNVRIMDFETLVLIYGQNRYKL